MLTTRRLNHPPSSSSKRLLKKSTTAAVVVMSTTPRISPLQCKGLMTLSLFLVAQNVAFVNAIAEDQFYSSFSSSNIKNGRGKKNSPFGAAPQEHEDDPGNADATGGGNGGGPWCPTPSNMCHAYTTTSSSRPPLPPPPPVLLHRFWQNVLRIGKKKEQEIMMSQDELCCSEECAPCMVNDQVALAAACQSAALAIPRGGHGSHTHSHSHAAAEAAATAAAAAVLEATTSATPYNIPLNAWKVIFQAILTAINVLCWLIPLRNKAISDNQLAMSLANAFSGGVFLSLAFGHLIPECVHGFDLNVWPETAPFLFVLLGYLLIFFVEKVAFDAHDILHEMKSGDHGHSHSHGHDGHDSHAGHDHHVHAKSSSSNSAVTSNGASSSAVSVVDAKEDAPAAATTQATTGRSALILLGALGIHSILEMMALGLTNSFSDGALLTLSIALHQPAESIALLVAFLKSGMPKSQILQYLSIFACMGPIGVALGMAVNEYAAPVVDSIMLSIVAGTFVYVGATEVIPEEWEDSTHKWKKFAALMSGIVTILCITQYTMSFHSH